MEGEAQIRTIEGVKIAWEGGTCACVYVLRESACESVCTCENAGVWLSVCVWTTRWSYKSFICELGRGATWLTIQARRWQDPIFFFFSFLTPGSLPHSQVFLFFLHFIHPSYFLFISPSPLPPLPFFSPQFFFVTCRVSTSQLFLFHANCWCTMERQAVV